MVPKALLAKLLPRKPTAPPRAPPPPDHPVSAEPGAREIGGPAGPEPTRYGDWERNGRCIDF
ncbi:MAG: DUF1674 domain-containing protein [Alphaproteobacteria bacterium]|nr:DUF1674 domain-containing protein [Alphaproteobacteria bacterium]